MATGKPFAAFGSLHRRTIKIVGGILVAIVLLVAVLALFPWDLLRQPLNRYISEKTGRKFEITRHLDVRLGFRGATVEFDGIEFANPEWARDPYLVKAERGSFELRFWPLLSGKVVIPRISLKSPVVGLQMEADGRRTWALGKDTSDEGTVPTIGAVQIDQGAIAFLAGYVGVDLHVDFTFDSSRGNLPLSYQIKGSYRRQPLTANGRTGNVLQLTNTGQPPFPIEIHAQAGQTALNVSGTVAELSSFDGIAADFDIKGRSLGDLFPLLGIALPQTSPYAVRGELKKRGKRWEANGLQGNLGLSDIGGAMTFDQGQKLPFLAGKLKSNVLDMDDLGPLIGLPPTDRSAKAIAGVAPPPITAETRKQRTKAGSKVLPTAALDFERLRSMNAEVEYRAERIKNVRDVPLDRGSVQVRLKDAVLTLDPLELGVASGTLAGAVKIDAGKNPAEIQASLVIRALQLNRLIPKVETLRTSFGKLDGRVNLSGRGSTVANWLGNASGDMALITGRGQFSNLLLEFMGLDGGEIIKFLLRGDHNVVLRCAALAFDVDKGSMRSRSVVFDTEDTVFNGSGTASLANETLDFVIRAEPKDASILSFRTPLTIRGTFASPSPGVEVAPLAGRGLAALALGALNPLLALAATVETGPGKDADCRGVLDDAQKPRTKAAISGAAKAKSLRKTQ